MLFSSIFQTLVISKDKSKTKKSKLDGKQKSERKKDETEGWQVFCDFHEITHAVIKDKTTVTIYSQDNMGMVSSWAKLVSVQNNLFKQL